MRNLTLTFGRFAIAILFLGTLGSQAEAQLEVDPDQQYLLLATTRTGTMEDELGVAATYEERGHGKFNIRNFKFTLTLFCEQSSKDMTLHVVYGNEGFVPRHCESLGEVDANPESGFEAWAIRDGNGIDVWNIYCL